LIRHGSYDVAPWEVRERTLDLDVLAQSESVFALSNGHIGLRGNLDEGEPCGLTGTYLNGFYETMALPYAEAGYGYPESGQSVVNATNGKIIRLLVADEPFDLRYGRLGSHERTLDLRAGTLTREVEWTSPTEDTVKLRTTRLVSLAQRAIAAIEYIVEPVDKPLRIVVQSELVANEPLPRDESDPRAAMLQGALESERHGTHELRAILVHRTKSSELRMAAGYDHVIDCAQDLQTASQSEPDFARTTFSAEIEPGSPLRLVKFIAYGWSARRSMPALRDQVSAGLAEAKHTGWEDLVRLQREYLDEFWERADVEIDGEPRLQQALRFGMFHVVQSGARNEGRAIPAKGLTGSGYDGHAFWDTETFVLPMLTYALPSAARDALRWRHATLDKAQHRADQLGLEGAAFPWRTIAGEECSSYWPAGTAAFHINADIAHAVSKYINATGDDDFIEDCGGELLVQTARLWRSIGHHDSRGNFRIDGVTGPDEYSAVADNNVFTNLAARRNLLDAAENVEHRPELAHRLGVDAEEAAAWRDAANAMTIPYDEALGVHPQSEGYTDHAPWNFDDTPEDAFPLFLHYPYFDLYRKQVVKQADLVLALALFGDRFTAEEKARDFAYYEPLTVRDSSLSACTQAVIAAEVGHMDLAYAYMTEAALMDLDDLEHNSRDGVHMASLAGAWIAAVAGFGGMRDFGDELSFMPRLPEQLTRLRYRLGFRGRVLEVKVTSKQAAYTLHSGDPLKILHHGEEIEVSEAETVKRAIPHLRPGKEPRQPRHREPFGARGSG
jgi:alpha,alpha-trehalose phosphorylase